MTGLHEKTVFALVLAISGTVRLVTVLIFKVEPAVDYAAYMNVATSLLASGHINDGQGNVAFYSPGYPLFLVPFFALFGAKAEVAQFVNVVLGVLSTALVYLCAREVLPSWRWAAFAALIWATYPPAVFYTEYVAKENLLTTLLLLQTVLLLRYPRAQRASVVALLLGLLFAFEVLAGPAVLLTGLLIGIVVSGALFRKFSLRAVTWRSAIVCAVGLAAGLAPWLAYTSSKLGAPVLNTNGSFNLYLGNNPNASIAFVGIEHTPMANTWHRTRAELGEVKAMNLLGRKALEYMRGNPGVTAYRALKRVAYFWAPPVGYFWPPPARHEKDGPDSTAELVVRRTWLVYYCAILMLALLPLMQPKRLEFPHYIFYGTTVLFWVLHGATHIIPRFRLPIMPVMAVLAVVGAHRAVSWSRPADACCGPGRRE